MTLIRHGKRTFAAHGYDGRAANFATKAPITEVKRYPG